MQDPPVLQLGVDPLARSAPTNMRGVDLLLVVRQGAVAAGDAIEPAPPLGDPDRLAAALIGGVGHRPDTGLGERVDDAVLTSRAHVVPGSGQRW